MLSGMLADTTRDFLAYVFWYYVLARYATRQRNISARTLRREKTTSFLLRLHEKNGNLGKAVRERRLGGHDLRHDAIWFRREDLPALLEVSPNAIKQEFSPNIFYGPDTKYDPGKPFWLHTTGVLSPKCSLLSEWKRPEKPFRLDDHLPSGFLLEPGPDPSVSLKHYFFADGGPTLPFEGAVFHAIDNATVFIARTRDEKLIAELPSMSMNQRVAGIDIVKSVAKNGSASHAVAASDELHQEEEERSNDPAARMNEPDAASRRASRTVQSWEELSENPALTYDLLVLRTINSVQALGIEPVPGWIVQVIADDLSGLELNAGAAGWERCLHALLRLEKEEWIARDKDSLRVRDAQWYMPYRMPVGFIAIVRWLLNNPNALSQDIWREMLVNATGTLCPLDELLNIVDALAQALVAEDAARVKIAEVLVLRATPFGMLLDGDMTTSLLKRAASLMQGFTGDAKAAEDRWEEIAEGWLRAGMTEEFFGAIRHVSDEEVARFVESNKWLLRENFERLAAGGSDTAFRPAMERLARAMDNVSYPERAPVSFSETFARWLNESVQEDPTTSGDS